VGKIAWPRIATGADTIDITFLDGAAGKRGKARKGKR
jgi:hypothetical protein